MSRPIKWLTIHGRLGSFCSAKYEIFEKVKLKVANCLNVQR